MFSATQYFSESIWIFQDYSHFTGLAYIPDHVGLDTGCAMLTILLNLILNIVFYLNFRPTILYRFLEFWITR